MKFEKLPTLGICVFAVLYCYAATLYPGGNQSDKFALGFDWLRNYWCDLLGCKADNGQPNPARPVAMLATTILCASLALFWYRLAGFLDAPDWQRRLVRASGLVSMAATLMLFSDFHDTAIIAAGGTGLVAVAAIYVFLHQRKMHREMRVGQFCLVLIALNNLIYWPKSGLAFLPVVQKLTFLVFLGWVGWIGWGLRANS